MGIFSVFKKGTDQCSAVVPAAGSSSRMDGEDKLMSRIGDTPVLAHTLSALELCDEITEIVVVTRTESLEKISRLCSDYKISKVSHVVAGGDTRAVSVYNGIMMADKRSGYILVHDGARPFVTQSLLRRTITSARRFGSAVAAVPVKDTIKIVSDRHIESTPERSTLYAAQTPQVFDADVIKAALENALSKGIEVTDDASAAELIGVKPVIVEGSYENIKITTPGDLITAEAIIREGKWIL